MNQTLVFFTKIFSVIILGSVWGYLTMFPLPHSETVVVVILPILSLLVHNLTKGLNPDDSNQKTAQPILIPQISSSQTVAEVARQILAKQSEVKPVATTQEIQP